LIGPLTRRTAFRAMMIGVILASAGWGLTWAIGRWRSSAELDRALAEMAAGRPEPARARLARLTERWPGRDEVEYRLAICESILGHADAAIDAWGRVPADSTLAPAAELARGRAALERGRLAVAEESLARAEGRGGDVGAQASRLIEQVLLFSGRGRELAGRFRRRWPTDRDPVGLLKAHWLLDSQPMPVGPVRDRLEQMAGHAPDDDRVWLGRADIATRTGLFDEADGWLRRCEGRRPDDPDVWHARLDWALASRRPVDAGSALARLPAARFSPAEVAGLRAQLAALDGDDDAERRALEDRVALEPGDAPAWSRLADLAAAAGQADRVDRFRRRKDAIDRARDEYRWLTGEVSAEDTSHAADLARVAEELGRRFEARGWWTTRIRRAPDDNQARAAYARLGPDRPPEGTSGRTLADLIPRRRAVAGGQSAKPAAPASLAIPTFRDDAEAAGLRFFYDNDQTPLRRLPETMGGGVGLVDYDGDGRLDVYCVQGGKFPAGAESPSGGDRLFRNRGDGTFEDATERSGIAAFPRGFGHGVAVGDVDNDGRPDLFVTRFGAYALYRNRGDGTFEDATERMGLGGPRGWPTSAAFADLDGDGDLDLYVCHYLRWTPGESAPCPDPERPGTHVYCVPRAFEAEPDRLYRNDGGRFVDVSAEAGIVDKDGRGLGVVLADLDDDGRVDIYVANDMTANFLFRNLGGLRFEESGMMAGAATNGEGGYQAGMGVACGDLDGDGLPELAVTNFFGESTTLFHNLGGGSFDDWTASAGLMAPSRYVLGFGAAFLDANDDGRLDLATANGHVNDYRPNIPYEMPAQLYLGTGGGRLVEVSGRAGGCWKTPRVGRGLAVGDLDNDGRQDLLIVSQSGPLAYFRNLGAGGGHRLTLLLEGTRSNRDGVGARVRVASAPGWPQVARRIGGGSFLSASDGRLHFGLGAGGDGGPVAVEVRWPDGQVDRHQRLRPDAAYRLIQGQADPAPLPGWPAGR